jgi:hypothetical protein
VKISTLLLGLLFFTFASLPPMAAGFELKGRHKPLAAKDGGDNLPGSLVIMERDGGGSLAARQGKSGPAPELNASFGKHRLSFSYHASDLEEKPIHSDDTVFNGRTFSLNEKIARELDYGIYDFIYQYDVANFQNLFSGFTIGLVGQLKVVESHVDPYPADRQRRDDFSAFPLVGLDLHMGILGDLLQGRFRATGMGSTQGNIFDGQAELALSPSPYLGIYGGYRFFAISLETDEAKIEYDNSGPYLGITLSF